MLGGRSAETGATRSQAAREGKGRRGKHGDIEEEKSPPAPHSGVWSFPPPPTTEADVTRLVTHVFAPPADNTLTGLDMVVFFRVVGEGRRKEEEGKKEEKKEEVEEKKEEEKEEEEAEAAVDEEGVEDDDEESMLRRTSRVTRRRPRATDVGRKGVVVTNEFESQVVPVLFQNKWSKVRASTKLTPHNVQEDRDNCTEQLLRAGWSDKRRFVLVHLAYRNVDTNVTPDVIPANTIVMGRDGLKALYGPTFSLFIDSFPADGFEPQVTSTRTSTG